MRFVLSAVFSALIAVVAVHAFASSSKPTGLNTDSICETYEPDCDRL